MMVRIESIRFENYRQYGTQILRFKTTEQNQLSCFIATNGTGKTTLLNAIMWCLYEKEYLIDNNDESLPLLTTGLICEQNIGKSFSVLVAVTVKDDNKTLEFSRTKQYSIRGNDSLLKPLDDASYLTVSVTNGSSLENTQILVGDDAKVLVKQYFDEDIHSFYFFDGEKLSDYFEAGKKTDIKKSIFNIAQISMLDNACKHAETMLKEQKKNITANAPDLQSLYKSQDTYIFEIEEIKNNIKKEDKNAQKYKAEYEQIDHQLSSIEPIEALQNERKEKEKLLDELEKSEKEIQSKRSDFLRQYLTLVLLYPRMTHILSIIQKKEAAGELPPIIDIDLIHRILNNHINECPLCNSPINESAIAHLQSLLKQISISSAASNNLKEIKSSLEEYIALVQSYPVAKREINDEIYDNHSQQAACTKRLQEISQRLATFSDLPDSSAISTLERKRQNAMTQFGTANRLIGLYNQQLADKSIDLTEIEDKIKTAEKLSKELADSRATVAIYELLCNNLTQVKEKIIKSVKSEIETTTWAIFRKMLWKQNTFGHIEISDKYSVSVFDTAGRPMTDSLSATEKMALAYAFTFAIHQASGRNCPLIIDSPLGRVSDINRNRMAEVLLEMSKDKQIVMLFTPDEYSSDVRQIYNNAVFVSKLVLSSDEQHVSEV